MKFNYLSPAIVGRSPGNARNFEIVGVYVRHSRAGVLAITLNLHTRHCLALYGNDARALFKAWSTNVTAWTGQLVRVTRLATNPDPECPDLAADNLSGPFSVEPLNTPNGGEGVQQ